MRHIRSKPAVPVLLVIALTTACSIAFAEDTSDKPAYPLWDGQESVEQYAKKVNLPAVRGVEQARVDFIAAKARYDSAAQSEKPAHPVTMTKPFYMGKFVVTQEQYQAVMGANPSQFKGKDMPVENVSWDDAQAFCKKLSESTHQAARLPMEAAWEYSCRAGTTSKFHSGDTEADYARVAWPCDYKSYSVGQKEPNAFGLYDMLGPWQLCQDWSGNYSADAIVDPQGPTQGEYRVVRGGTSCWTTSLRGSAYREMFPNSSGYPINFRVEAPASSANVQR